MRYHQIDEMIDLLQKYSVSYYLLRELNNKNPSSGPEEYLSSLENRREDYRKNIQLYHKYLNERGIRNISSPKDNYHHVWTRMSLIFSKCLTFLVTIVFIPRESIVPTMRISAPPINSPILLNSASTCADL